ncbi:amidohydrolase [Chitinophaga silvatica]|uniref:Amidohydrolase n=1 Tax=Chitinophaga silvatica TaxID=2282649 RepID=A0A3E1YF13_9BACT|nr:amidohydrolase family protein [Chitinophaga silvatica]RFS24897.1 amidohydrolase [Chitinophaga silvatica]
MIIDSHQHFWQYDPIRDAWIDETMHRIRRDFMPEDLAPVYAANGIDGCVAVQVDQTPADTTFLLNLAAQHDFIKGVVGWVDLRADDISAQLEQYTKFPKLKGFRHIVQGEPDNRFLLGNDFCRGISALSDFNFTYDILVYPKQLPAVEEFVLKFPDQRLIIDHLAKPEIKRQEFSTWAAHMKKIAQSPNVYCKVSGMVTEADWERWKPADFRPYLETVLEAFGPQRLVYGSDWPVCLVAAAYNEQKKLINDFISTLAANEQANIMGGNAITFYQL